MIRLAEFLGIDCEQIQMAMPGSTVTVPRGACLVINPEVVREWTGGGAPSHEMTSSLVSSCRSILIHAVRPDPFHSAIVESLTAGCYQGVKSASNPGSALTVAPNSQDVCGPYAGISVCKANVTNDRTFSHGKGGRDLITIDGEAQFAVSHTSQTEVFLLGSEDVADLDSEVGRDKYAEFFSRFVPHAIALRFVFGQQSWRPVRSHACVIVDDPLLRARYGFLDFGELLRMMQRHNFSTTLAFIPRNCRRSSSAGIRFFSDNPDRLSLCFHGNDHTGAEFASVDSARLNTMIQTAEHRMAALTEATRLHCDRVMVFPQGKFSVEAMAALRVHNFQAVINTEPSPWREQSSLTLRDLAQPAVLRYVGFPLFLRKSSKWMDDGEIAFRLFFGIPLLMVEHHDTFENPQRLLEAVDRINKAAPEIIWSSAGQAVRGSILYRRDLEGNLHINAYANSIRMESSSQKVEPVFVHWNARGRDAGIENVQHNKGANIPFHSDDSETCVAAILDPERADEFSIHFREEPNRDISPVSFRYNAKVFVRRRLSEFRDNYVSRSPLLMKTTKALRRRVQQ